MSCHFSSPEGGISLYKPLLITLPFPPATLHTSQTSKGTHNEFPNGEDESKQGKKTQILQVINKKPKEPRKIFKANKTKTHFPCHHSTM